MRSIAIITFWMASFLCIAAPIEAARILAIIPIPSYSHQIPYRPIWSTLSQRGHEVVVLTTDPINNSNLTNLTEINFKNNYAELQQTVDFLKNALNGETWLKAEYEKVEIVCNKISENIYKHHEVRKMYAPDSGQKFDVVIVEVLMTPSLFALAHRFNAPLIGKNNNKNYYTKLFSNHIFLIIFFSKTLQKRFAILKCLIFVIILYNFCFQLKNIIFSSTHVSLNTHTIIKYK